MNEYDKSNDLPISISIIDYIGKIENGVGILFNININDTNYEISYWYNRDGDVHIVAEQKLLNLLEVNNIYEYSKINELVQLIYDTLSDPNAILDEFIKD